MLGEESLDLYKIPDLFRERDINYDGLHFWNECRIGLESEQKTFNHGFTIFSCFHAFAVKFKAPFHVEVGGEDTDIRLRISVYVGEAMAGRGFSKDDLDIAALGPSECKHGIDKK